MHRLNEPAPAFEAKTTHGVKELSDYKDKWLVLFCHPADFTPVCTTEFMAFAKYHPEFQKLNCELIGLYIDSYYAHVAWVRNIKEKFGVDIPFLIKVIVPPPGDVNAAEARHIEALHTLYTRYGLSPPANPWPGKTPRYASLQEACEAGVAAEIANGAMYERLLVATKCANILIVFRNLQEASQQRHLPAFQRCAQGVGGGGLGGRCHRGGRA